MQVYSGNLNKLYDREVKDFILKAKQAVQSRIDRKALGNYLSK